MLIAVQVVMGAFDTLYHHELTERLAWRPAQGNELALHAGRNLVYALVFVILGLIELHGTWAIIDDGGAGDRARHHADGLCRGGFDPQAAGVRTDHSHPAGAQLRRHPLLLLPVLIGWAATDRGSALAYRTAQHRAATAAAGAVLFGVRDLAAEAAGTDDRRAGGSLVGNCPRRQTVLVTGATGSSAAAGASLSAAGHQVIALIRNPAKAETLAPPVTLITSLDQLPAGQPHRRHRQSRGRADRQRALDRSQAAQDPRSRLSMTGDIVSLIARLDASQPCWSPVLRSAGTGCGRTRC